MRVSAAIRFESEKFGDRLKRPDESTPGNGFMVNILQNSVLRGPRSWVAQRNTSMKTGDGWCRR